MSGRLPHQDSIASSLYRVAIGGLARLPFTVVPGPRREFNLVFNEQTDANVPGSIIDSLTVVAGESAAEVWLSLEGVGGAFLGDDESVTVIVSLLSDNEQFTATDDDGGVLDTVVLTSTDNGLIRLDATANAGLDVAFSATVTAMVNPDQAGLPAADFNDASLSVSVVPLREFNLVFNPSLITIRAGDELSLEISIQSEEGSILLPSEEVVVDFAYNDAAIVPVEGVVLSADNSSATLSLELPIDAMSGNLLASASLVGANIADGSVAVTIEPRAFALVFRSVSDTARETAR